MRINKWLALHADMSRRSADSAVINGRVKINDVRAELGAEVNEQDTVYLDGKLVWKREEKSLVIILNKPTTYVCSRAGQGSKTVYDLLPSHLHHLKAVGRLDKDSSGLLLMTNDGELHHTLTHPSFNKQKRYEVTLDRQLSFSEIHKLNKGIALEDGLSKLHVTPLKGRVYEVKMSEGRNRQIRRTFAALNILVTALHRTDFGPYHLGSLLSGKYIKAT